MLAAMHQTVSGTLTLVCVIAKTTGGETTVRRSTVPTTMQHWEMLNAVGMVCATEESASALLAGEKRLRILES